MSKTTIKLEGPVIIRTISTMRWQKNRNITNFGVKTTGGDNFGKHKPGVFFQNAQCV